jgi:hypothetical protein
MSAPLYRRVLGPHFDVLPARVRELRKRPLTTAAVVDCGDSREG